MVSLELSSGPGIESEIQKNPSPLQNFLKQLGMNDYYPSKLSPQTLRTIEIFPNGANVGPQSKENLPWQILKQIMLLHNQSREDDITKFAKTQPKSQKKTFGKLSFDKNESVSAVSKVPHPMDVMQVLFMCSDYAVRQILARKLFMCRLAIPFIIPSDRVEVLLWPLRSIILEWKSRNEGREEALVAEAKEEALAKCKMNMVVFLRYGENSFSKSSLMNNVVSSSGHATFFHEGSPCGKEQRVISNGMVEMSHFLPADNDQDAFQQPILLFNLRGDACNHDIQRQVLMDLATVLVIVIDISELRTAAVQEFLKQTVTMKQERVAIVFTDNRRHNDKQIEELQKLFCELIGDAIEKIDIVTLFDEQQNASSVVQEVRDAIAKNMLKEPDVSLEELVTSSKLPAKCDVDEHVNEHCRRGKEVAENILKEMYKVDYHKMKETFLPKQGECLTDLGKELRNLKRTCRDNEDTSNVRKAKTGIQKKIDSIREKQGAATGNESFMMKLISMFHEGQECREFAMRWVQLALDDLSRLHLPRMNKEKATCWEKLTKAREGDSTNSLQLENELHRIEDSIESATCGWEHLMREFGQKYEVSLALNNRACPQYSSLPEIVGQQLLEGHPVELMDGDHGVVPIEWVKAVFQSLVKLVGNKKILVLSVLGIQSSGKSTMLNTMFGLEFAVSAGRCTRGIYAQLLPVKDHQNQRFDYLLVLDSEGLRSQQREKKYQHDNELATLVIGLSDVAMINMKGENITEMADVLEIVVLAFVRMKLADSPQKRKCMIIHQNVAAVNAEAKLADDRQKLQEQLNVMAKEASEALGLSKAITSFNRIISFDSQQDVVYFPDLWSGDPPMAAINQGYSRQASETQKTILHRVTRHFNSFITIEDFVVRANDMWNGVLSDDFIFSFRNTLAAKAYIEVEKELLKLQVEIETELFTWVRTSCAPQIRNCETVPDLETCWKKIEGLLPKKVNKNIEEKKQVVRVFFEKHQASDIIEQWKSQKVFSLDIFGRNLEHTIAANLHNVKGQKLVQLRQTTGFNARKQDVQRKAIGLAESLRGRCLSPDDMQEKFDVLWEDYASDLTLGCTQVEVKVLDTFDRVLRSQVTPNDGKSLTDQLDRTPLYSDNSGKLLSQGDILDEHIMVKDKGYKLTSLLMGHPQKSDFFTAALEAANDMLRKVKVMIDAKAAQDTTFTDLHAKETLDALQKAYDIHNSLSVEVAGYAFTPQFKAMLAVCTSCIAIAKFEKMNERYEKKYGVKAQMDEHKQRVFGLFKNAIVQASAEITAADYFCAALKAEMTTQVSEEVRIGLKLNIISALGASKRGFIIAILDEFAQDGSFDKLCEYLSDPSSYANTWLQIFVNDHLFERSTGETKYAAYANNATRRIFTKIESSVCAATESTSAGLNKDWYEEFCMQMRDTAFIAPSQLRVDGLSTIQNVNNFQSFLTPRLEALQAEIKAGSEEKTTVDWLVSQSQEIFEDLWGCKECCPMCNEPCQFTDANQIEHKCIQHRPNGLMGTVWSKSNELVLDPCDILGKVPKSKQEREWDKYVNGKWHIGKNIFRLVYWLAGKTDFSKVIPKQDSSNRSRILEWNFSSNPSGEVSKYWQWIMVKFQENLEKKHEPGKLEVPEDWEKVTEEEARASLRKW